MGKETASASSASSKLNHDIQKDDNHELKEQGLPSLPSWKNNWRPLDIYVSLMSNSTKLIGWDAKKMNPRLERVDEQVIQNQRKQNEEQQIYFLDKAIDFVIINAILPSNSTNPKQDLYKLALSSLKEQRNIYTMGAEEVNNNKKVYGFGGEKMMMTTKPSLGQEHLNQLSAWFIPSPTVHNALRSTVSWTYSIEGPLFPPIKRAVVDCIPLSQQNVNSAMKSTIIWFLKDENMRKVVKGSTQGYVSRIQTDDV